MTDINILTAAVDQVAPLIIGITGETGTGKTVSSLRLAIGMCRVLGGKPLLIDTNSRRGLHYRRSPSHPDGFDFDYIDFSPPFCPLEYKRRIESAVAHGSKVIIVDTMSDEHNGEGGVMDQVERWLDKHCKNPNDEDERYRKNQQAHARVKPYTRSILNRYIEQLGRTGTMLILTYRSHDKSKPVPGGGIVKVGYEPETTSTLRFLMTQGFLLLPGDRGKPCIKPETATEKIWTKSPMQFDGWVTEKILDEAMGEKLARWAAGGVSGQHVQAATAAPQSPPANRQPAAATQPPPAQVEAATPDYSKDAAPACTNCQGGIPMKLVKAGISRAGKAYGAFWSCPNNKTCGAKTIHASKWREELLENMPPVNEDADEFQLGGDIGPDRTYQD
mgnify:CR=1 FL=1